jgi:predicted lipid carrier protein YhbT
LDLNPRSCVLKRSFVNHDIETPNKRLSSAGVTDVDVVHLSSVVRSREVVSSRDPACIVVAGTACRGLVVLTRRTSFDGRCSCE